MSNPTVAFSTPATASGWKRWLVFSPVARIMIFVVAMAVLSTISGTVDHFAFGGSRHMTFGTPSGVAVYLTTMVLPAVLAYLFLVRVVEQRRLGELAAHRLLRGVISGILGGLALFSAVVGILWLLGSYHVTGTSSDVHWLLALLSVGVGAGIGEEVLFRGVLYRIAEEGLGTWWALLISALFFGFAHSHNPGATAWSSAAIAIEAGILLALLYHVTRSLWPCIGLHAAWNFAQGTIYGIPVSGSAASGWLVSTRTGPDWLSGGVFGAEASVVALALCLLCSAALLAVALRRGSFVRPSWRRRR
ncbi:type II CAAX endopeptidase family protein [Rhodanobacter sp. PCA2]|uniref:CPBP family intramembrane glutamic endopeptidase n=1 Tax=Rhodanobacter sp. PCA2 TaxID=2006117 RepID=UPI0015E77855|nr:type II CAAX endopeptidase family protein [Rhodanobacter sp. PCA2]MBA2077480.1 CPBP family intramembrane metalloprotease domain-containing protein [Rhodanobacter sp. PCA2]